MNFAKFRQTGELSDISVIVDKTEFKLHKFPLYAKSDFFCALAKSPGTDCNRVELKEFPGGPDAFAVVADFCYSMKVDINKVNVVHIRCAAEVLQMTGAGNLSEVADKFLTDTITSAKMSRSTSIIASLLVNCLQAAAVAEKAKIVEVCSDALVDCWLKPPTKFSTPPGASKKTQNDKGDDSIKILLRLPLDWYKKLFELARDKRVQNEHLVEMAMRYISHVIDKEDSDTRGGQTTADGKKPDAGESKPTSKSRGSHDGESKSVSKSKKKSDIGKVLDAILLELPESAYNEEALSTQWVTRVLKLATSHGCACHKVLVRIAGDRLNKLSPEDLCIVSPSVLRDIVVDSCSGGATPDSGQGGKACQLVETYLNEMARKGVLTAETYKSLVTAAPMHTKQNQDSLYGILEYVLTAEKDKLSTEQRAELLETVNFSLVGEATLRRAFETQVVPASFVAKGALALCAKLKSELESARTTVFKQEDELQRLRRARTLTPTVTISPKKDLDSSHSSFSDQPVRDTGGNSLLPDLTQDSNNGPGTASGTEDVLMAARNKLVTSVASYNTFRPLSADVDYSYDDDLDYKYDRSFRSYENSRIKPNRATSFRSSYLYPHRM